MLGRQTYGVSCGNGGPTEQEMYPATKVTLRKDGLGLGTILYM